MLYFVPLDNQQTDKAGSLKIQVVMELKYTTRQINRCFKIKVEGIYNETYIKTLVGVSGLLKIVGSIEMTNKLLDRAFSSRGQKCVCRLRRGLCFSFYNY